MRKSLAPSAALVLAGLFVLAPQPPGAAAQAPAGKVVEKGAGPGKGKELSVSDKLTAADPEDKVRAGCRAKVYPYEMTAGQLYTINLQADFPSFVRLESRTGKDFTETNLHVVRKGYSFLWFRATKSGTYRIVVTSVNPGAMGAFTLGVVPWADLSGGEKGFAASGQLTAADPTDPKQHGFAKIYGVKLTAGRRYVIDLISGDYDAYLRLLDGAGAELAANDDNGVSLNSRIIFRPGQTGHYQFVATSLTPGCVGKFSLWVTPVRSAAGSDPPPPVQPPRSPLAGLVPVVHPGGFLPINPRMTAGDVKLIAELPLAPVQRGNDETHGYVEYRLTVHNEGAGPRRVAVTVPRFRPAGAPGNYLRSLRRAIDVPAKSSASLSLFQPDLPFQFGNDIEVTIDGQVQHDTLSLPIQTNRGRGMSGIHFGGPAGRAPGGLVGAYVLAPHELAIALEGNAHLSAIGDPKAMAGMPVTGLYGIRPFSIQGKHWVFGVNHVFSPGPEPKRWGCERWLGFSAFDGVALRAGQLDELPAATRAALWRYVECGGGLLLVGAARVPDAWKRSQARVEGLTAYYPGFGQCLVVEEHDPRLWTPPQWRAALAMWERTAQPWQYVRSANDANTLFPVVEGRSIPVRGLFVAMLVFAVLVGPVNVYLLTRKKRRIWLLWTVPVFSMLTCLAVFGLMMVSEGLSGQVRAEGVTVLDEGGQRAVSVASLGVYSAITPADGLHFGYDTEVTPQLRTDPRTLYRHREGQGRTVDWTHDQHLDTGWVRALVPAHFLTRTSEQRLERLVVRREGDGSLRAVNGLKAPIMNLWLADAAGKVHTAENVPPGKEVTLKASGLRAEGKADALRAAFAGDWLTLSKGLQARPEGVLRPGTYLAVLDGAPFLETGLRGARLRPGHSVVFGILKEIPGDAR